MNKPKVIKDFLKLDKKLQEEVLELYPNGFQEHLILFTDRDGKYAHALPYETEDRYYLLRMPPLKPSKTSSNTEATDDDGEDDAESFNDLDTMKIGGNKQDDDDEEYD